MGESIRGSFLCSLRPEHCGALAVIVLIWILESKISVRNQFEGSVKLFIDNAAVIKRLNGTKQFNCEATDSDVWQLTLRWLNKCRTKFTFEHVKAHQEHIVGPNTWEQTNNTTVDLLAKRGAEIVSEQPSDYLIRTEFDIIIDDYRLTANFSSELYSYIAGGRMRNYIQNKYGWNDNVFFSVDWESFGEYFHGLNISKLANVIKYIYDWQFTKKWETKIEESKNRNKNGDIQNEITSKEGGELCPTGCGLVEDHHHYLSCKVINSTSIARILRLNLLRWMRTSRTDPKLIILINQVIAKKSRDEDEYIDPIQYEDDDIKKLIREQNEIGWSHFFKGRMSKEFIIIQEKYYEGIREKIEETGIGKLSLKFKGSWWMKEIIKRIIFYSLNMWQIRNEFVHGENRPKKAKEKDMINKEIVQWYGRSNEYIQMRYLFELSLVERCMKSQRIKEAWLRTVRLEYIKLKKSVSD